MCTCRLADAGARVIKIERPEGDFARGYDKLAKPRELVSKQDGRERPDAASHGESAYFVWLNRGKESLVLDLARDDDKAVLAAMLARADVFVQNLKPGATAKLGFPLDAIAARASAADHLLDLRLRRGRPLRRAQGLRHADPGRIRARLGHRLARRAGARRRLGLRRRRRDERLRGHPRGADRARASPATAPRSRSPCSTPWPTGWRCR